MLHMYVFQLVCDSQIRLEIRFHTANYFQYEDDNCVFAVR